MFCLRNIRRSSIALSLGSPRTGMYDAIQPRDANIREPCLGNATLFIFHDINLCIRHTAMSDYPRRQVSPPTAHARMQRQQPCRMRIGERCIRPCCSRCTLPVSLDLVGAALGDVNGSFFLIGDATAVLVSIATVLSIFFSPRR